MSKKRTTEDEPTPVGREETKRVIQSSERRFAKRFQEVGEVAVVVLKVGAAAVALYAAVKGIGLVN
jgi:hypothetical protein